MSRFVEILNSHEREISVENFPAMLRNGGKARSPDRPDRDELSPFINKLAPVSGVPA